MTTKDHLQPAAPATSPCTCTCQSLGEGPGTGCWWSCSTRCGLQWTIYTEYCTVYTGQCDAPGGCCERDISGDPASDENMVWLEDWSGPCRQGEGQLTLLLPGLYTSFQHYAESLHHMEHFESELKTRGETVSPCKSFNSGHQHLPSLEGSLHLATWTTWCGPGTRGSPSTRMFSRSEGVQGCFQPKHWYATFILDFIFF